MNKKLTDKEYQSREALGDMVKWLLMSNDLQPEDVTPLIKKGTSNMLGVPADKIWKKP